YRLAAVAARNLVEQALELADIAVDGALEVAIRPIALADLVERLLALQRVEAARERVAVAALVALPQLRRPLRIDHPRDTAGDRVERSDAVRAGRPAAASGFCRLARRRGAGEEIR